MFLYLCIIESFYLELLNKVMLHVISDIAYMISNMPALAEISKNNERFNSVLLWHLLTLSFNSLNSELISTEQRVCLAYTLFWRIVFAMLEEL